MAGVFFQELFNDARGALMRDTAPEVGFGGYTYTAIPGNALMLRESGFGKGNAVLNAAGYGVLESPPPSPSPTGIREFELAFKWRTLSTLSTTTGTVLNILIWYEDPTDSSQVGYHQLVCAKNAQPQFSVASRGTDSGLLNFALANATVYDLLFKVTPSGAQLSVNGLSAATVETSYPLGPVCGLTMVVGGLDGGLGNFIMSGDVPVAQPLWTNYKNTYEVL